MVSTRQYIDKDGKAVIDATKYESAAGFSDGLAAVKVSHKGWGFIDKAGSLVIPPRFESATSFSEGLAGVLSHGESTGTLVIENKFDWVGRFSERVAVVQRSSKPKRPAVPLGSPSTKIVEV